MKRMYLEGTFPRKITSVFLAAMTSVFLLYTGPDGYAHIVESKYAALCLLCGLYLGALALVFFCHDVTGKLRVRGLGARLVRLSWPQRFAAAYLLLTWVSALVSENFPDTLIGMSRYEGALTITLYCLVFFCVSAWAQPGKWFLWVFAASMTLQNGLCILQLAGANPLALYPQGYTWFDAGVRYSGAYLGTIGNTGLLGAVYCIAIPVFLLAICKGSGRSRLLLLIPLAGSAYVAMRMDVLACFVGLGTGLALSLPFALARTTRLRWALLLTLACAGFATLAVLFFFDPGAGFFHELHELLRGRAQPQFGSGRLYIWENVLRLVPHHILFGAGPDTMAAAGIEPFTRWDGNLGKWLVSGIDAAHSEYLNILYHQGVFALAAYLALLGCTLIPALRRAGREPYASVCTSAAVCYAVQACFGISMCVSAPFLWICLGLLCRDAAAGCACAAEPAPETQP